MAGFTKLDSNILDSSVWGEPEHVRVVWFAFLAKKDQDGFVATSYGGMRRTANLFEDHDGKRFDEAIKCLEGPDSDSRTKDNEGRRILRIEGGWMVLNHKKYRDYTYSSSPNALKQKAYRERKKKNRDGNALPMLPNDGNSSASASVSASVSDIKKEEDNTNKPEWIGNYDIYKQSCKDALVALVNDEEWMAQRKEFKPRLDIKKSLKKAYVDFWGAKTGWKHKKEKCRKRRDGTYPEIDWKRTFTNALDQKCNHVWLPDGPSDDDTLSVKFS